MNLHLNLVLLEQAIRAAALELSLPVEYVEKDYWVTLALKNLVSSNISNNIVFKGGTSLSKAYSIISRFSEDIDIAVLTNGLTRNQSAKRVKKASKALSKPFVEIESPDTSKNSHFRKVRFAYPRIDNTQPVEGQITNSLLLEVNAFADPEPYQLMQLSCYVAEFLIRTGQNATIVEYELEPFEMNVLCTTRTVCEKIMGLVKASHGLNHIEDINRKIRHLYDIHFLMIDEKTGNFVESDGFHQMAESVIKCDQETFASTPWFNEPLSNACVFSRLREIWPLLKSTYYGEFRKMVVGGELPSEEMLIITVNRIHKQLVAIDQKTIK